MRRILVAASVFALLGANAALAASAVVEINASQAPSCEIVTSSGSITLGAYNVGVPGTFQYKCNFIGDPNFNFKSANGGVMTLENGGHTATYGIFLNDDTPAVAGFPTPTTWLQSSGATGGGADFFGGVLGSGISSSTTANALVSPVFEVGLTGTLAVAGAYSDLLTITITP